MKKRVSPAFIGTPLAVSENVGTLLELYKFPQVRKTGVREHGEHEGSFGDISGSCKGKGGKFELLIP